MGQRHPIRKRHSQGLAKCLRVFEDQRGTLLAPHLLDNPAWKIVLELYLSETAVTVDELARRVALRPSSLVRYLKALVQAGIVVTSGNGDAEVFAFSEGALDQIDGLLIKVREDMLAVSL